MSDYAMTPNDLTAFAEAIRAHFPGLIDIAFDGDVQQTDDEELMTFNEYAFRVHLDNGATFDITIQQRGHVEDASEYEAAPSWER